MQLKTDENRFICFLKDEKFIEWKLFPTEELDTYWEEYLRLHSGERNDMLLAEKYFGNIDLSSLKISRERKEDALLRLKQSLDAYNRKRRVRRFTYAAACIAMLILSALLYLRTKMGGADEKPVVPPDCIVGSELEPEDILFISGNSTVSFQSNVDIRMDGDQTAQVKNERGETEKISIEENTVNRVVVPYGKRSNITLADGTQVWLNSGSSLEFSSGFAGRREVFLSGEMYAEVTPDKNKPFRVHTSGYDVKVYGTKLNISTYAGSPSSVVLVDGSVGLQSAEGKELFLSPSEQAVFSESTGTFDTRTVDVFSLISWREGYLSFEDTALTEALKQIERYYNLLFNYGDNVSFRGLTCTGKIILSENPDNAMTALTLISDTRYRRDGKRIYIYKES
ncbi:MAG: FecR domain-containing protein [Proteiniphilum sp.]|nr:FecR domain-containing protein [Proteiniphilum sp.]